MSATTNNNNAWANKGEGSSIVERLRNSSSKLDIGMKLAYDSKSGISNVNAFLKAFAKVVGPVAGTNFEDVIKNGVDRSFTTKRSTKTKSGSLNEKNSRLNKKERKEEETYRDIADRLVGSLRCNMSDDSWTRVSKNSGFEKTKDGNKFNLVVGANIIPADQFGQFLKSLRPEEKQSPTAPSAPSTSITAAAITQTTTQTTEADISDPISNLARQKITTKNRTGQPNSDPKFESFTKAKI